MVAIETRGRNGARAAQKTEPARTAMTKDGTSRAARKARAHNAPRPPGSYVSAARVSDIVYRDLRQAIVSMRLPPGAPIVESELTARHKVSRTPVREAVLRLAEERLVDVVPKSGTHVARIPISVVREAIVARRALETVTVREAAAKASASEIMQLRTVVQRQIERAAAGDESGFHRADEEFHSTIAATARYPGIWEMIQQIRVQVERYRRLTLPQPGRMQLVIEEHGRIVEAIAAHDPDMAEARMIDHLDKLRVEIAVFRDLWPDYFIVDPTLDDLSAQ